MAEKKETKGKPAKDMSLIGVISAYIEQIVEIQTVVDKAKIDDKTIKKMTKTLKQSVDVLKVISENKELIQAITQNPIKGDAAKKFDALCSVVKALGDIAESLKKVGTLAIPILIMKPLISKVIGFIIEINDQLAESKKQADPKMLENIVKGLVTLGKGLLTFLVVTAFGLVPLAAIVALLAVRAFLWVMEQLFTGKSLEKLKEIDDGLREIAITLFLLAGTVVVLVLAGLLIKQGWKQMLMVMAYLAVVTLIFIAIAYLFEYTSGENSTDQIKNIAIALVLIALTAIIMIITGEFISQGWKQMLIVAAYLVVVTGIFLLIGMFAETIEKGTKEMLWVVLATVLISLTAVLLIYIGQQIEANWQQLLMVTAFLVIITGLFVVIGLLKSLIDPGVTSFILMSVALIVFGVSMLVLHAATGQMTWGEVGIIIALVGVMSLISVALGAAMPWPLLGAVALFALGAAMLFIAAPILLLAKSIETLKKIKATGEDMARPIHLMGALVGAVLSTFGGIRGMIRLARAAGRMMMLIPIAISLGIISRVIADIASLKMPIEFDEKGNPKKYQKMEAKDFMEAATNAAGIASTLANLFGDEDFEVNVGGQKVTIHPITEKMLEKITGSTVRKMAQLMWISVCIGGMAKVLQKIASLNMPDDEKGYDSEGKPKGYKRMKSEDFIEAATNAAAIAKILSSLFGDSILVVRIGGKVIKISPVSQEALDGITGSVTRKMNRLSYIVGAIGNMAGTLQKLASLIIPDDEAGFDKDGKPKGWRTMKAEDFATAASNVVKIATTLLYGLTYYKDPTTGKTTMDAIDDMSYWAMYKLKKAMEILSNVSGMVDAVQLMASMSVPTKWDKDGKPIAFRTLTDEEREKAIINTTDMVCFFLKALTEDDITEALNSMGRRARKNIETVMNSTSGVSALVDAVVKATDLDADTIATGIANLKECILRYAGLINELFVDVWEWRWGKKKILGINVPWLFHEKVKEAEIDMRAMNTAVGRMNQIVETMDPLNELVSNIKQISGEENTKGVKEGINNLGSIVKGYCEIFTGDDKGKGGVNITPTGEKKFAAFKQMVEYHDFFAKVNTKDLKANTDNFVRFIDKANQLDADKIVKQTDMWKAMTEFMESMKDLPFEELADAIVNKIAPAMSDISEGVDKMSSMEPATPITQTSQNTPQGSNTGDPMASKVNNAPTPVDYSDVLEAIKRSVEEIVQQKMMGM